MYRANRNTSAELLPPTAHANEFVSQNIFGRLNAEAARRAVSATQLTRGLCPVRGVRILNISWSKRFSLIFIHRP